MVTRAFVFWVALGLLTPAVAQAKATFPVQGIVDISKKTLSVTVNANENPLSIQVEQIEENKYKLVVNINHLETPFLDMAAIIEGEVLVSPARGNKPWTLTGEITSKYTLLNYKPVEDLQGKFTISQGTLTIDRLSVGTVRCEGTVELKEPFEIDMLVHLSEIPMNDFLGIFVDTVNILSEGDVAGDITITGSPAQVQLQGKLSSYNGFVNQLKFNSMNINAAGIYPNLYIADSQITQTDGMTFQIDGTIDLSDQGNLVKQIRAFTMSPLVSEDGAELEWTLKRVRSDKTPGTTEVKYMRRKFDDRLNPDDESSDMIGIERKMEF